MPLAADVRIRRATPPDARAAAAIIGGALADYGLPFEPDGRDADVAFFGTRDDHDDFIADRDGIPVGVVSVGPQGDPGIAWLSKLFVLRAARRLGIGRALLDAAHAAARTRGNVKVSLRTRIVFREAIGLYEASGYMLASDRSRELTSGDVVYERSL